MPYCPQCRDEYVDGIARCPDCEADLVDDLSSVPPPAASSPEDDTPIQTVGHRTSEEEAEDAVALLLSIAVPARIGEEGPQGWPIEVPEEFGGVAARVLGRVEGEADGTPEVTAEDLALLEQSPGNLRRQGAPAVTGLVRVLVRGRGEAANLAAVRLSRIGPEGVAALGEALVEAVSSDSGPLTSAAVKALRAEGEVASPPGLSELTLHEDSAVRIRAVRALAGLGGGPGVPFAVALLRDAVEEVREEAADAIWEMSQGRIDLDLDRDPEVVAEDIRILEEHYGG